MKQYKIVECVLNEYTDHPTESVLAVVDAADAAAASQKARLMFPNRECKVVGVANENV